MIKIMSKTFNESQSSLNNFNTINRFFLTAEADISLPLETLVTTKGNSVKPWCDVTGGETFIGWYDPKGSKITSDTSQRKHVESDGTRHYLSLQTIDPASDGGVYECRGDTNKRTLTLKVNCK